ncbi:MAG: T9SS type A sorting domain-containing protein [Candidatus Zixiibacteriota bacterium]
MKRFLLNCIAIFLVVSTTVLGSGFDGIACSDPPELLEVQLESAIGSLAGSAEISITLNQGTDFFGSYDFLIAYQDTMLTFADATIGSDLADCWEYFNYFYFPADGCDGHCPSELIRIVAIADVVNGSTHPDQSCLHYNPASGDQMELARLRFRVSHAIRHECMFAPVRFFWLDCGNNVLNSVTGDSVWNSNAVFSGEYAPIEITGDQYYGGHWWIGNCTDQIRGESVSAQVIDFISGGIDIVCTDQFGHLGDLNLNSIIYEISDLTLFAKYFIYGVSVFDIDMPVQVGATDINNDGVVLSLPDFMYMIRVINGDVPPYAKLSPFAYTVTIEEGAIITANSQSDIGAALFVFSGEGDANLLADGMKMESDVVDGQLRVLIWSDSKNHISAGTHDLFGINAELSIIEVEVVDYYGNLMNANIVEKVVPSAFTLNQNYPNPFNPSTDIIINLPTQSNWKLDIYNVSGQLVRTFSGNAIGEVTVTWDAAGAASGIYFYKATAGQYTDTRKMLLMK